MKKLLWLFIIATTINTQAQYTIKGVVTDAKSNKKLAGVNVYISKLNKGTVSNIDGKFIIKNITKSEVILKFSYLGYKDVVKKVLLNKKEVVLEIKMQESVFEMDEVIISTAFNKLQEDNVMKVNHKSIKSMERSGVQNLMDGIEQIPGVAKLSTGAGINKPVIRGLTGNRVLVFNQGVKLENFQFGEAHGMGIESGGIEGIEVIKGPASLLYGSDALGGVVYLIPEKFAGFNKTKANIKFQYFSNTKGGHVSIGAKTSGKKWQYLSRFSSHLNADYQVSNQQRVFNSRYRSKDVKLAIGRKTKTHTTELRYNYNQSENGLPVMIKNSEADYTMQDKYQDVTNHNISIKNNFDLSGSKLKTNVGFTAHKRILKWQNTNKIGMQLNTFNLDAKYYLPKKQNIESIIGLQAMWQNNNNFGSHYLLPDAEIQNAGVFSTINYQKNKTVWQAGLRYDFRHISTKQVADNTSSEYRKSIEKYLNSFTGSVGVKTDLTKKTHLRINIASGFRAPNLAELTSKGVHGSRVEIGNENLHNEQNIQFDINMEYESTHFEFFANSFYNRINNYIYLEPQNSMLNSFPVYVYQQNNAYLYGGEIGFHLHPHPLDWLHLNSSFETVTGMMQNANYLPLIPANQWKNQIRITNAHPHKQIKRYYLTFDIHHTFSAEKISNFEEPRPAYTLLNSSFGMDFKFNNIKMTSNLSVHNLLNINYISHLSSLREKNIPNMGRNIILTLNVKY